jgi:cyclohexa-1,5-dienecarbonyl-CoA hydratase
MHPTSANEPVTTESIDGGAILRVYLATPKANILDERKVGMLTSIFERAAGTAGLKAVLIEGAGPNFSFGASVEEHLPGRYESMIPGFHRLFDRMLDARIVTLAAVRGQCLGGGLELASFCHRVLAAPDAKLGQPEIVLGVFAPVASVFLAERLGRARAEDLCLTGRTVTAEEALRIGLVDEIADDPGAAALAWARRHLLPRSASSLRQAAWALRAGLAGRFRADLDRVEAQYLGELMATRDAQEGLVAFLEKRSPRWHDA